MTKVYFDPECGRIFGLPLDDTAAMAREALLRTEHVPELDALHLPGRENAIQRTASAALDSRDGCAGDDWQPVVGRDAVKAWLVMLLPTVLGVGGLALWLALK